MAASRYTRKVPRPDLLLVGALLHDIGKGRLGITHKSVWVWSKILRRIWDSTPRTSHILVQMVRHHLLLPEVATGVTPMIRP